MLVHNLTVLRECGDDVEAMAELLAPVVQEFLDACDRLERRTPTHVPRLFRIHWDGDFFSANYAVAWRETIRRFPTVHFWTYTRSFTERLNVVPILHGLANLTLYLSVDVGNYADAQQVLRDFPGVPVSVLAPTTTAGKALYHALTGRNAAACAEKVGKLPLVTNRGEGACITCGLCVWGRKGVVFPAIHARAASAFPAELPPVAAAPETGVAAEARAAASNGGAAGGLGSTPDPAGLRAES